MARRKPKFAINRDRFTLKASNKFSIVGVSLDPNGTGRTTVKLRANNIFWVQHALNVISDNEVQIDATPDRKNPRFFDGDDDLTVTVTVDDQTANEETTEVTYEDIIYDPGVRPAKAQPGPAKKKKK